MAEVLHIPEVVDEDGRFSRFQLIQWWDQPLLARSKVLVIGAGALGNEILKNLALLGVGNVFVADLDKVENSNLSRSVLFREQDCGTPKSEVAVRRMKEIYPGVKAQAFTGNVVYDLGLGVYKWADVVIGGLDNREARVAINQSAARAGRVWIDGAIERLEGVARVFNPATGPCYECTMSEVDWKMLNARRSCALLTRQEMQGGKVPTTPTTASVVAGIQCQEAIKLLHGRETLNGQGFVFDGSTHQSYMVSYKRKPDCPGHDAYEPWVPLPLKTSQTTAGDLLERARSELGPSAVIEFNQELLEALYCEKCKDEQPFRSSLGKVTEAQGRCPTCGEHRVPKTFHTIGDRNEGADVLGLTLAQLGVPAWDVVGGRVGLEQRFYEFAGDRTDVLGALAD